MLTCSRRKVEDKNSQHASEDAGHDDVDDVEKRFPLYDEVEGDVLIEVFLDVLSCGFVTDGPLSIFYGEKKKRKSLVILLYWHSINLLRIGTLGSLKVATDL